jgi:hypothetical protein
MADESDFIVEDGFGALIMGTIDPSQQAEDVFLQYAIIILQYAKDNAPWADRTGDARNGLDVDVYQEGDQVVLELYHTVSYGEWLETIQDGAFATIMPTLERFAAEVFEAAGGTVTDVEEGG